MTRTEATTKARKLFALACDQNNPHVAREAAYKMVQLMKQHDIGVGTRIQYIIVDEKPRRVSRVFFGAGRLLGRVAWFARRAAIWYFLFRHVGRA